MNVPMPPVIPGTGPIGPLRISIGIHSLQLGGSQINTIDLARELRSRGHDVHIFAIYEAFKVTIVPIAQAAGFEIEVLPAESSLVEQARRITEATDRHDAQVVHVYHEDHWLGPLGAIALRARPNRSLVVTNWMMKNNKWLPLHAPLILGTQGLCEGAKGFQRGPIWLLEPPVDTERDAYDTERATTFRHKYGFAADDVLVVLVSRVDRVMKLDAILRAIASIAAIDRADVGLAVVGDGDALDLVREHAKAANVRLGRQAVVLTGALHDPRPAYDAADIALGMGGSALRSLAFRRALVVVGEDGFSEVFSPESADLFLHQGYHGVGPPDPDGARLTDQIRTLLDPSLREELAEFGARVVRERYALPVITDRLERIYAQSIAAPTLRWQRLVDVVYVRGYDLAHRALPSGLRRTIRSRIPLIRPH